MQGFRNKYTTDTTFDFIMKRISFITSFCLGIFLLVSIGRLIAVSGQPPGSSCWTDRSSYNVGDTITVYYQLGMSHPYYLYVFKPDGSTVWVNLGSGGQGTSSTQLMAGESGQTRIELWMSSIDVYGGNLATLLPQYVSTCNTIMVNPEFPLVPALSIISMFVVAIIIRLTKFNFSRNDAKS